MYATERVYVHETQSVARRRTPVMLRLVATIVTLFFLFALGATSGYAVSFDGSATTVTQTQPAHLAPTLTADVPLIEKDGELDPVLIASYVIEASASAPDIDVKRYTRCIVADAYNNVPRYLAARRILI